MKRKRQVDTELVRRRPKRVAKPFVRLKPAKEEDKPQPIDKENPEYHELVMPKEKVANICCSILTHPARHLPKLKILVNLLDIRTAAEKCKLEFITTQKLIAFSILEVFIDIIPSYRVKEKIKEEAEEKRKLKKTTYELRNYEATMLAIYKLYLLRLKRMVDIVKKPTSRPSTFYDTILKKRATKERICLIGLKCLSQLLLTHPHFNLRSQIIQMIVPLMTLSRYPSAADKACECISQLYQQDKLGEVSLEAIRETEKLIKACGIYIRPQVIETFLELKIKEVSLTNPKKDMNQIRKEWEKMSRKDRRRKKAEKKLENQLLETEAQESVKRISEFHTKILNHIFATYFRFLKRTVSDLSDDSTKKERFKILLSPVLEGLTKFCHLINLEFFDDIVNILYRLMKSDLLDTDQTLNCCYTVFTILSGDGSIMNVDHQRFYSKLYQIMPDINCISSVKTIGMLFRCLETMILRRKKQVTFNRVLAFMKRCAALAIQNDDLAVLVILTFIRRMIMTYPKSDLLLDLEGVGNKQLLPDIEDEQGNVTPSPMWELHLLNRHSSGGVREMVQHIFKGCPSHEIKPEMASKTLYDFYEALYDR